MLPATPSQPLIEPAPLERWGFSAALIGAPALYLIAQVMLVLMPREETLFKTLAIHSDVWLISHVLLVAWLVLLIPSVWVLWLMLSRAGWLYRAIGALLASVGIVANAIILGLDFVFGSIASLDETVSRSVHEIVTTTVLAPLDQLDTALPLGLIIISIGLYRTRAVPAWLVLFLLAGLALPSAAEIRLVPAIVQLLSVTVLALVYLRRGYQRAEANVAIATYSHPVLGALIALAIMLPGAFFSFERLGFAVLVFVGLVLHESWVSRTSREPAEPS
ncbi:MAG: hypothetical protein ACOH1J_05020 [Microbacteriaceae bacterium]